MLRNKYLYWFTPFLFALCFKGFRWRKRCSAECILTKTSWGILGMFCKHIIVLESNWIICFTEYWFLMKNCQIKVDFGDFRFLHIKPKAVRYVSGVATAILGSGGMWPFWMSQWSHCWKPIYPLQEPIFQGSKFLINLLFLHLFLSNHVPVTPHFMLLQLVLLHK